MNVTGHFAPVTFIDKKAVIHFFYYKHQIASLCPDPEYRELIYKYQEKDFAEILR
ncbi:MAG: hypothetical protein JXK05_09620 [Campylobacterales bacterium]|nr:hypothetical protein [Campylobacterales bacterium]